MLTKEEFNVLLMLYAASIDGSIRKEEAEQMLAQTNPDVYKKVKKSFSKMSDVEVLNLIHDNKNQFITNDSDKQELLKQLQSVIRADDSVSPIEGHLQRFISNLL